MPVRLKPDATPPWAQVFLNIWFDLIPSYSLIFCRLPSILGAWMIWPWSETFWSMVTTLFIEADVAAVAKEGVPVVYVKTCVVVGVILRAVLAVLPFIRRNVRQKRLRRRRWSHQIEKEKNSVQRRIPALQKWKKAPANGQKWMGLENLKKLEASTNQMKISTTKNWPLGKKRYSDAFFLSYIPL